MKKSWCRWPICLLVIAFIMLKKVLKSFEIISYGLTVVVILKCYFPNVMFASSPDASQEVWITSVHGLIRGFVPIHNDNTELCIFQARVKRRRKKRCKEDWLKYWTRFLVFVRNSCIVAPTFCPTWPDTDRVNLPPMATISLSPVQTHDVVLIALSYVLDVLLGTTPHTPLNR